MVEQEGSVIDFQRTGEICGAMNLYAGLVFLLQVLHFGSEFEIRR